MVYFKGPLKALDKAALFRESSNTLLSMCFLMLMDRKWCRESSSGNRHKLLCGFSYFIYYYLFYMCIKLMTI